jgi:hypothetical protein
MCRLAKCPHSLLLLLLLLLWLHTQTTASNEACRVAAPAAQPHAWLVGAQGLHHALPGLG